MCAPHEKPRQSANALPLAAVICLGSMVGPSLAGHMPGDIGRYHQAQLLVADRGMPDPRFRQSVIFMVEHDDNGAFGLIVNKRVTERPLSKLLDDMGVGHPKPLADDPTLPVRFGGPVETSRVFVLHTPDYRAKGTAAVTGFASVSVGSNVLTALADGEGPERAVVILGYAGWSPGQLEREFRRDDWFVIDADAALVFGDPETMWRRAIDRRPIDL